MPTLRYVAKRLGGTVERDGDFAMVGTLRQKGQGILVPFFAEDYAPLLAKNPGVTAVITNPGLEHLVPESMGVLLVDGDPFEAMLKTHLDLIEQGYYPEPKPSQMGKGCRIHPSAHVAERGVVLGDHVVVEANATVLAGSHVGNNVHIGPGSVIGGKGFEVRMVDGTPVNIPHVGGVSLGDRVEVLANTCIARSLYGGHTRLDEDVKVDTLVSISHNGHIGARTRIGASAVLSGSLNIGQDVWIGPNATLANGLTIGDGAWISLGAVVTRDVPSAQSVSGNFAIDHDRFIEHMRKIR